MHKNYLDRPMQHLTHSTIDVSSLQISTPELHHLFLNKEKDDHHSSSFVTVHTLISPLGSLRKIIDEFQNQVYIKECFLDDSIRL